MPTIKKTPSGSYRAQPYSHTTPEGKRVYASITGATRREVVIALAEWEKERVRKKADDVTVGEAIDDYIAAHDGVLSPSTIFGYKKIRRNYFGGIMNIPLSKLTDEIIQKEVNELSKSHAPKSVRNITALLSSALKSKGKRIEDIKLPQKVKSDIIIPSDAEMKILFDSIKDTELEIPVILAAICGMRRSEIAALRWENVNYDKNHIMIKEATVHSDGSTLVTKTTKTTSSTRTIKMVDTVKELLQKEKDSTNRDTVCAIGVNRINDRLQYAIKKNNLPHFRFHDLRHYAVSVMLALNIPKNYIASYMGHSTERMIEQVYGHIMAERKTEFEDRIQGYFNRYFK